MQFTEERYSKLQQFEHTNDGAIHYTRALIQNDSGDILGLYDKRFNHYQLPGGKVDAGESKEEALYREVMEETGCKVADAQFIGAKKLLFSLGLFVSNVYTVSITGKPTIQEPEKFSYYNWGSITRSDTNKFGVHIKFPDNEYESENDLLEGGMYELVAYHMGVEKNLGNGDYPMSPVKHDFVPKGRYHQYFDLSEKYYFWSTEYSESENHLRVYTDQGENIITGIEKVYQGNSL